MGRGHLSLGTMILTVEPGRGGEGSFVSLGTMILTVEPGRGGEGSFVNTEPGRGVGVGVILEQGRGGRGDLSLGTMILGVERGGGGVICL